MKTLRSVVPTALLGLALVSFASCGAGPKASNPHSDLVNMSCPIMNDPLGSNPSVVEFEGAKVGFCCEGCAEDWEKKPAADKRAYVTSQRSSK